MAKLLSNPRTVVILLLLMLTIVVSLLGGALGNAFGLGFLATSLPAIQLPAELVVKIGPFPLMNTMITTWLAMAVILVITFLISRKLDEVPGRLQALLEIAIEFFLGLCESVAGKERARKFFPLVFTIFLFVVIANWMGILPGFGTIGRVADVEEIAHHKGVHEYHDPALKPHDTVSAHSGLQSASHDDHGVDLNDVKLHVFDSTGPLNVMLPGSLSKELDFSDYEEQHGDIGENKTAGHLVPFLRSANTDVNMTLAMAIVAMIMVHFWGFSILGPFGHIGKFINVKEGPIGFFVGILEIISEIAKVISFTFRLFGNIFAGEVLLMAMAFLLPLIGIVPFLGVELFVGIIQAFIFSMLTLVFAAMATVGHSQGGHN